MSLFITVASIVVAVAASLIAWMTVREDRRRSNARVAALIAASSASDEPDAPEVSRFVSVDADPDDRTAAVPAATHGLFGAGDGPASVPMRRAAALAVGVLALVGFLSAAWLVDRSPSSRPSAAKKTAPLELVSLSHERRGAELTISGLVRNPADGIELDSAQAVVLLFDEQNRFVTSARSPLDIRRLAPGGESPFRVTATVPLDLGRYRVSFRRVEGALVPHVDRRAVPMAAPQGREATPSLAPVRRVGL